MIRETRSWIRIVAKNHAIRAPQIAGKWLCFGPTPEMHAFRDLLNKLVEDGTLLAAKIARKDPATDPFPHKKDCVICIFTSADQGEIERVRLQLLRIGLPPATWKSEQATKADWASKGKLALEAEVARKRKKLNAVESTKPHQPRWNIFISKNSNDENHARQVHEFLTTNGLNAFLSEVSLPQLGLSDFQEAIEQALEECEHLVVVTSSKENLESRWVRAEWRMFLNELRSGRKTGNVLTVLAGNMTITDLPLSLRSFQVERLTELGLQNVYNYLGHQTNR